MLWLGMVLAATGTARASTNWWDGVAGGWDAVARWSAVSTATAPDPAAVPGSADVAVFNVDGSNTAATVDMNAEQVVSGIVVRTTGRLTFRGSTSGTTERRLTVGPGGIELQTGAKLGSDNTKGVFTTVLGADQVWRNVNAYASGANHNFNYPSPIDLAGHTLTIVGEAGLQLANNNAAGTITNSGGAANIVLAAGGLLKLQNITINSNRIADAIGLVSYGGTFDCLVNNGVANPYFETVGTLNLAKGAFNHVATQAVSPGTNVVTYGGLTHTGGKATVLFASGSTATAALGYQTIPTYRVLIVGQASTSLFGGWATVDAYGFAAYDATDSAGFPRGVYGSSGAALAANTSDGTAVYGLSSSRIATTNLLVGALTARNGNTRTLTLGAYSLTIASGGLFFDLAGDGVITGGTVTAGTGSDTYLYVTVAEPLATTGTNVKRIASPIVDKPAPDPNTVGLVKAGVGVLTLEGANTYSGDTAINEGTLYLSTTGSIANSSSIEVLYGATLNVSSQTVTWTLGSAQTLKGNGTVTGDVTVAGTVAPGDGTGTLRVNGNIGFSNGSVLDVELRDTRRAGETWEPGYDRLKVAGMIDLGSNATLQVGVLSGASLAVGDLLFLVDNDGADAVSGSFKTPSGTVLSQGATFSAGGQSFQISYAADLAGNAFTGGNDVALKVVKPVAGTVVMLR